MFLASPPILLLFSLWRFPGRCVRCSFICPGSFGRTTRRGTGVSLWTHDMRALNCSDDPAEGKSVGGVGLSSPPDIHEKPVMIPRLEINDLFFFFSFFCSFFRSFLLFSQFFWEAPFWIEAFRKTRPFGQTCVFGNERDVAAKLGLTKLRRPLHFICPCFVWRLFSCF